MPSKVIFYSGIVMMMKVKFMSCVHMSTTRRRYAVCVWLQMGRRCSRQVKIRAGAKWIWRVVRYSMNRARPMS